GASDGLNAGATRRGQGWPLEKQDRRRSTILGIRSPGNRGIPAVGSKRSLTPVARGSLVPGSTIGSRSAGGFLPLSTTFESQSRRRITGKKRQQRKCPPSQAGISG